MRGREEGVRARRKRRSDRRETVELQAAAGGDETDCTELKRCEAKAAPSDIHAQQSPDETESHTDRGSIGCAADPSREIRRAGSRRIPRGQALMRLRSRVRSAIWRAISPRSRVGRAGGRLWSTRVSLASLASLKPSDDLLAIARRLLSATGKAWARGRSSPWLSSRTP